MPELVDEDIGRSLRGEEGAVRQPDKIRKKTLTISFFLSHIDFIPPGLGRKSSLPQVDHPSVPVVESIVVSVDLQKQIIFFEGGK